MTAIDLPPHLVARIGERGGSVDTTVARAMRTWLDLTDARSDRGAAAVDLLDGIGSAARGESATPDQGELAHWLVLLNRLLGSDAEND
jgi:hypothetical protein